MKSIKYLLFLCCALSLFKGEAQTYPVGVRTITYTDASRSNRSIGVEVHYPAGSTGSNTALASDSFPFIVFGHGFQMTASAYYPFADTLAQRGYIVAFPTTESSLLPSHPDFAQDLIYVYNGLLTDNANSGSPFYHHVVSKGAIAGHSMGGGCTILSASYSNPAVCYFTMAEATTNPSSVTAASSMTKPYLSFSGSYDCIAPYGTNQEPTYDSSHSPCKVMIEINGASHCQFGLGNLQCNFGEGVSGCASPPLARTAQINTVLRYLEPYLDYYLKGICRSWTSFDSVYNADAINTKTRNCTNLVPTNPSISGATSFCTGSSTVLSALPAGFIYQWSTGQSTSSISISAGGSYSLTVGNGTCSLVAPSVTETLLTVPATPTAINGLDSLCSGSTNVIYSVPTVAGVTAYNWTVPSGWTVNSGAGSNTLNVSASATPGNISLIEVNGCGPSGSLSKSISLDSLPHLAGSISGADTICLGSSDQVYTFNGSTDGSLVWSVSAPYSISSGQSTGTVHISGVDSAGVVTLISSGTCGQSAPISLQITVIDSPQLSGTISGADTICQGNADQVYVFNGSTNGNLQWSVSGPLVLGAGQSSDTIHVSGVVSSGTVTLVSTRVCGQSASLTLAVAVIDTPNPTVVQSGDTLRSSVTGASYQWYLGGQAVSGANNSYYLPTTNGSYAVVVTNGNGCSGQSAALAYINTATRDITQEQISIYPNPANDIIYVQSDKNIKQISLLNALGQKVASSVSQKELNISQVSPGIYLVEVTTEDRKSSYIRICKK